MEAEFHRAAIHYDAIGAGDKLKLAAESRNAIELLLGSVGVKYEPELLTAPEHKPVAIDAAARMHAQVDQLVRHTQKLVQESTKKREIFWAKAYSSASSAEHWQEGAQPIKDYLWDEVIGRLPAPSAPANPRTRLIYDEPKFRGYEVMLDVWPGVFAYGILLLPKGMAAGERRPVVVCQHGLEARAQDVTDPNTDARFYHHFAATLAEQGFVTYAPQNPYIGEDRFRILQRLAHPLKLSLFSFMAGQHSRTLEWLSSQPFVDPARIGFYGFSYGGTAAMRLPVLLDGYALSICSANFTDWVWKNTDIDTRYSYLLTREYDMLEFDFANVASYSTWLT